jgi:hypothetical protein
MIDWARLEDVRERRRRSALEALLADRRAVDAQAAALRCAEQARTQAERAKTRHWQAAGADPALSVGALAGAAAWSRVLDERIAREGAAVAEAQARAQACARAAEASREALRRAAGGVEKAVRLAQQARLQGRRREDARLESAAEDLAAARWAARRARKD